MGSDYDDAEGPDPDELRSIQGQLSAGGKLGSTQVATIHRMAASVGIEVPMDHSALPNVIDTLLAEWTRGSRATGDALICSREAEKEGNISEAIAILAEAREQLKMPFYDDILLGEEERLAQLDS